MKTLITTAAALVWACGAAAQQDPNCNSQRYIADRLAAGYGESRQAIGTTVGPSEVEIYANLNTGTWTIVVISPAGMACMVAAGQDYETVGEVLPPNI